MTKVARISEDAAATAALTNRFALTDSENDPMAMITTVDGAPARPLAPDQNAIIADLAKRGVLDEMTKGGWLTPSRIEVVGAKAFLVQPQLLPPVRPGEMPPAMRQDAARIVLQVSRVLDRHGFVLASADMSGVFIDQAGRPQFHDLLAIRPKDFTGAFPYRSFHATHLAPIRLLARQPATATLLLRAGTIDVAEDLALSHPLLSRLAHAIGGKVSQTFDRLTITSPYGGLLHAGMFATFVTEVFAETLRRRRGERTPPRWTARLLDRLSREIEKKKPAAAHQHWTGYYARNDLTTIAGAGAGTWRDHYPDSRARALIDALGPGAGRSLLDIGANQGYYALLAAHSGFDVTAIDFDIAAINALYNVLQRTRHPLAVRPLVGNFVSLQPVDYPRLRADAAIALGFVHHMRLVELLPWSAIAARLAGLTNDILVTEFKPDTKATSANSRTTVSDYDINSFVSALQREFSSVDVVGAHTAPGSLSEREMVVCRK